MEYTFALLQTFAFCVGGPMAYYFLTNNKPTEEFLQFLVLFYIGAQLTLMNISKE